MAYEFVGAKYERVSSHQREWGMKLISELDLQGTERVLDLGCGDGFLTAQIADRLLNGEVAGIDASQGMIEATRGKERQNLRFILMDIDQIDFRGEFDVVFSNAALHWVKDHERLPANVFNALRAGGRARFNFGGYGNCPRLFRVLREAMALGRFDKYFSRFEWPWCMPTVAEYEQLVRTAGFSPVRVWGDNIENFFTHADAMIGWLEQPCLVPFLAVIAEPDKKSFRDFTTARMLEENRQSDGRFLEIFRRINLFAVKPGE